MQLYMRGIDYNHDEDMVKTALATYLHRPPFPNDPPLNFHVKLFNDPDGYGHRGSGILTLPDQRSANLILKSYSGGIYLSHRRKVIFEASNRDPDQALIHQVASTPWIDPEQLQLEEQRIRDQSLPIELRGASFGRFCMDGVFSAEYDASRTAHHTRIICDIKNRQLRLEVVFLIEKDTYSSEEYSSGSDSGYGKDDDMDDDLVESLNFSAHFNSSSIVAIATPPQSTSTHVFIEAAHPPVFARGDSEGTSRSSSLHSDEMPPVGKGLYLDFYSEKDVHKFTNRLADLHVPYPKKKSIKLEHRHLYSPSLRKELANYLSCLPFPLAFEIEKSVLSGVLVPADILYNLKSNINKLGVEHRDICASVFTSFALSLKNPGIETVSISRRPTKARRSRKRKRTADATLSQQLDNEIKAFLVRRSQPRSRLLSKVLPSSSSGIYQAYHLVITPTGQHLEGPLPDQSNSVLRRFGNHDCFLRVTFEDELGSKLRRSREQDIDTLLQEHYRPVLVDGVNVAGRHFEFLGYSMSGLKEYAFLFVHPFIQDGKLWDGQEIRKSLGNFKKIQNQPALLAARWSQAFSGSHPSVTLQPESIQHILDRRAEDGSLFTDGVGKISPALAREVNSALQQQRQIPKRSKKPPSAYQFRIGGAKGVVVVDPTLKGRVICLRKSQVKFEGNSLSLDISNTSARPIAVYLNRALIVLLEHHGVSTEYIKVLQRRAVDEVQTIIQGLGRASVILRHHGLGTSFRVPSLLKSIHSILGLDISIQHRSGLDHQLIITSLHYALTHILGEIKHRAHIHVPGSHTLIGVADEWDCLEEGEIFATVTDRTKGRTEIVGDVLITRSPQIHPGDVQMVQAVRRPQLEHLTNVVVFSCRGSRSLPSMLGGGDLDGDIYNLIVDPNLHPPGGETHAPGDYQPLPRRTTPHTCTLTDVADFVIDFIKSDLVGIISNLHLRISDLDEGEGPACEDCLYLAEKASHAVDFPKTGTPVDAGELPFPRNSIRPDFLSGEGVNPTHNPRFYPSAKLLGELYRNIPDQEFHPVPGRKHITDGKTIMDALKRLDLDSISLPSLEHPTDELTEEMGDILEDYSTQLAHLAKVHSASRRASDHLSEAELVSGTIQSKWIDSHKRREAVRTMNMQTHELVTATRREIRGPMPEKLSRDTGTDDEGSVIDDLGDDGEDLDDCVDFFHDREVHCQAFTRAFAAWRIAEESLEYDSDAFGSSSFGLLALGIMLDTVKAMMIITYGIPH